MTSEGPILVWLRRDLRCDDNPALAAAAAAGSAIVPVFVWNPEEEGSWAPGAASRWWLHHSLAALSERFERLGAELRVFRGAARETLLPLAREIGAKRILWNRRYEPAAVKHDTAFKAECLAQGIEALSSNGSLLHEPWQVRTKEGGPYKVFTPFAKACLAREIRELVPAPKRLRGTTAGARGISLEELGLLPKIAWDEGIRRAWEPGEAGAKQHLDSFLSGAIAGYDKSRDEPATAGTSRLSPHLHFGEISPQQIWHAIDERCATRSPGVEIYRKEILWREFAFHLLFHFPATPEEPLRREFGDFPWVVDKSLLRAWQRGRTGYPIVDAGMRELWTTGWMHNRVRMIVASFLVKDLFLPWQKGAEWFWDTLVDADLANNTLGWQWTAGCGADASPFFRVFNPSGQGERFDPDGGYVKQWCPELAGLSARWIHRPWEAPREALSEANVMLGETYPEPIVEHAEMRARALEAYADLTRGGISMEGRTKVAAIAEALGSAAATGEKGRTRTANEVRRRAPSRDLLP